MSGTPKLTKEQKDEIRHIREEYGTSYPALAARFDVSPKTIMRICRPEIYEKQKASNRKYQSNNVQAINQKKKDRYRVYSLSFHMQLDAPVIQFLDNCENLQDYIRQKILEDINLQDESTVREQESK